MTLLRWLAVLLSEVFCFSGFTSHLSGYLQSGNDFARFKT
jgi:hypothetical protein